MRAVEVKIHNLRSVHDATLSLQELSLIAGANNAGKSNAIDAIRMFYGDLRWDEGRDFPKVAPADDEAWVEVEFKPTEDELLLLKDEYRSDEGTFRVRNYIKNSIGPDGKARAGYYAYVDGVLSETLFYGAKNVGSGKVGKLVYIPAVSKVDDHTKLTGPSALRDLTAAVLSKVVATSPAYKSLTEAFTTFEGEIRTHAGEDGQSLEQLEQEITGELSAWESSFSFGVQSVQPDEILKSLVKPRLVDDSHGGEVDQLRFGAGFQRHLVYTLIKLAASHSTGQKPATTRKDFSPQLTWILFEEPEAFLHPSQEEVLHDSLIALTADGATQVLLTTHSSRFVSRTVNDLTKLIRIRRDRGVTTTYQVTQERLDELLDAAFDADRSMIPVGTDPAKIDRAAVMAALKIELWLQPLRCAAFFANRVILVEGPTETALHAYLASHNHITPLIRGVLVIDTMGKFNIHRFVGLFSAFGIDHAVLYDGDNGDKHDAEATAAINAAKSSYTREVVQLESDIESELGIEATKNKWQKPQYLLYHLTAGLVDEEKLNQAGQLFARLSES